MSDPLAIAPACGAHRATVSGLEVQAVQRLHDALDREGHVGAGIAVGDR